MDLRLLGSIVILSTVTLTVVRTSTTVATTSKTVATTLSQSSESPSTSGTVSLSSSSKTSSSVNPSSTAVPLKNPSSTSIPMITTSSSVATTTSEPAVPPLSSSFTSTAAHTTSEGGSQSVSPTTLSQTIQGTKVLSNTTPSSSVKISVTTKAEISPSAHSPGRNTSNSVTQQQPNSSIGGTTSHISPLRQSDSLTTSASLGVRSQPGPSSVSPTLTVSSSLHQEHANSTVVTRTTRSFAPTTQALMPSPSPSSRCTEYTVFEKDCSKTCSNVGGQVKATEWCPSYSTVPANRKLKRTKTVQCKDYCSASSRCTEYTVFEKDCSKTCSNVGGQVEATEWCPSYSTVPANRKLKRTKTVPCEKYCSASSRCTEFTVFEKDCSETCSNVGGQIEATEWCPSYSTVLANRTSKRTKTVQCKDYCSGTETFRSLLSTVIVGILLFMISQLI